MNVSRNERLDPAGRTIVLLGALVAFGPLSIDTYLPSLPAIALALHATEAAVQLTISAFLVGFCSGMLVYGPLSDRYGRRPVLLGGIALYVLATLACALADDVGHLVALRALQAFGGGAAAVLARAIVRDIFPPLRVAPVLSLMQLVTMVAPLLAPILGGYLMLAAGWRAIFFALAAFGAWCFVAVWLRVPETHLPHARTGGGLGHAFRGYAAALRDPATLGYLLSSGACFVGLFAYITASPFVYIHHFGVPPQYYGYLFGLNVVGIIIGSSINARVVGRLGPDRMLRIGTSIAALAGLVLSALAISGRGGLMGVVLPLVFYVGVIGLVAANAVARLFALHPERAGAISALAGAIQFGCGTLGSLVVGHFPDGGPLAMCATIGVGGVGARLALVMALRAR